MLGVTGALGYFLVDGNTEFGVPTMPYTRNGVSVDTMANVDGLSACASDTFDPATLTFDLSASQNGQCWPWSSQVVAMVRTRYTSSASDTSTCTRGHDALQFLQWLHTAPQIDTVTDDVVVLLASSLSSAVQDAYIAALDSVLCDGTTLLVTLPTAWTLTAGIAGFVQAVSSLGLLLCAVAAVLVWLHRAHPVIRSASPLFLLLSICGVCLLYVTGFLLVSSASAASCSGFQWALNFGLMLTFAPLFAKTYRIYRIFGRKKLSVVQLSNRKLLTIVACIVLVEAVLQAIWQAVGPIAPLTHDVTGTSINAAGNLNIQQYVQCGVANGPSMSLLAVICVEKGLLFVFGALMAFTTRRVSSTFNESQGISLAIYNLCFTIGIIAPIIVVVSAVGDVLTLLLAFALLWIAYFTAAILLVPKLLTIYNHNEAKDEPSNNSVTSSSSNYQFLSLAMLNTLPMLLGYQAAVRKHLDAVDVRVTQVKRDKNQSYVGSTASHKRLPSTSHSAAASRTAPQQPHVKGQTAEQAVPAEPHSTANRVQLAGAVAATERTAVLNRPTHRSGAWRAASGSLSMSTNTDDANGLHTATAEDGSNGATDAAAPAAAS